MQKFEHAFTVRAPLATVARFHHDTRALKRLTPPPIVVQLRNVEPLAEGSVSEFTLWFGPLPVPWVAVHSRVDPQQGFTDTQARGPMKHWRHTHCFSPIDELTTRVSDHVAYEHHPGLRGLFTRLLFARPACGFCFATARGPRAARWRSERA